MQGGVLPEAQWDGAGGGGLGGDGETDETWHTSVRGPGAKAFPGLVGHPCLYMRARLLYSLEFDPRKSACRGMASVLELGDACAYLRRRPRYWIYPHHQFSSRVEPITHVCLQRSQQHSTPGGVGRYESRGVFLCYSGTSSTLRAASRGAFLRHHGRDSAPVIALPSREFAPDALQ